MSNATDSNVTKVNNGVNVDALLGAREALRDLRKTPRYLTKFWRPSSSLSLQGLVYRSLRPRALKPNTTT